MLSSEVIKEYTDKLNLKEGKMLVYKYIDINGAKALFEKMTFKFSNPNDFNDPFDLYESLIDFTQYRFLAPSHYPRRKRRELEKASPKLSAKSLKLGWRSQRKNFGISCFSKTYKSILMWSHYAEKHSGICIGFLIDVKKFMDSGFIALAVEYEKEFAPLPYLNNNHKERIKTLIQYISLKADIWEYEREIRLVNYDYYNQYEDPFLKFSDFAEIKELYFGLKMSLDDKKSIKKILSTKKLKVKIQEMAPLKNKFELDGKSA